MLHQFIVTGMNNAIVSLLTLVGIGIALFCFNWRLAALALLPMPLVALGICLFARKIRPIYRRRSRKIATMTAVLAEAITGASVVRAFAREKLHIDNFTEKNLEATDANIDAARLSSRS